MECNFQEPTLEAYKFIFEMKCNQDTTRIMKYIEDNNTYTLYETLCKLNYLKFEESFELEIKNKIEKDIEGIDVIDTQDESDVLINNMKLASYYAKILDLERFNKITKRITDENPRSSLKIDIILCRIRISLILDNKIELGKAVEEGEDILKKGCDWDRRNKFKTYQGIYYLFKRDFLKSSELIFESLPSFESKEFIEYEDLVLCYIFVALISFERKDLKEKIILNSNVNETRNSNTRGIELVEAFYESNYHQVLPLLHQFIVEKISTHPFLYNHMNFFIQSFILKVFKQLLDSYKSLSLETMADLFGVSIEYVEYYIVKFITNGSISCMIDGVTKTVFVIQNKLSEESHLIQKGEELIKLQNKLVHR